MAAAVGLATKLFQALTGAVKTGAAAKGTVDTAAKLKQATQAAQAARSVIAKPGPGKGAPPVNAGPPAGQSHAGILNQPKSQLLSTRQMPENVKQAREAGAGMGGGGGMMDMAAPPPMGMPGFGGGLGLPVDVNPATIAPFTTKKRMKGNGIMAEYMARRNYGF